MTQRAMPSAPEAEASLLGTMLVYPAAARTAIEAGLTEDDFYNEVNKKIFTACREIYAEGQNVDLASVSTRLKDKGQLEQTGGLNYLTSLSAAAVTSANTKGYVQIIHDKALVRAMILTADQISAEGMAGQTDVTAYLDNAEKAVLNVSRSRRTSEFQKSSDLVNEAVKQIVQMSQNKSDVTGLKTGYQQLDSTLHGFQNGDLIILAARPSMGKTAVALNFLLRACQYAQDKAAAMFSLEMSAQQLTLRLLSAYSRVKNDHLRTGRLSTEEWNKVNEAAHDLAMMKLYIDDTPGIHLPEIFSKCRRLQSEEGLSLVVIDYIQLITGPQRSDGSRQQEVSDISRGLKSLARELNVPVIALSQLSREVEKRNDRKPILSDLRESGAIEQDADVVMLLYRESYYDPALQKEVAKAGSEQLDINIAKHRNGAIRHVNLAFEADTNAVLDMISAEEPEY